MFKPLSGIILLFAWFDSFMVSADAQQYSSTVVIAVETLRSVKKGLYKYL